MIGIGIGIPYRSGSGGGGGAPTPLLRWSFDDTSRMWQDTGLTAPADATSDPISAVESSGTETLTLTRNDASHIPTWDGTDAAVFDGTDDAMSAAGFSEIIDLTEMRLALTFEAGNLSSTQTVAGFSNSSGSGFGRVAVTATTGRIRVEFRNSANATIASEDFYSTGITAGKRYTIVILIHDDLIDFQLSGDGENDLDEDVEFDLSGLDWVDAPDVVSIGARITNLTQENDDFTGKVIALELDAY